MLAVFDVMEKTACCSYTALPCFMLLFYRVPLRFCYPFWLSYFSCNLTYVTASFSCSLQRVKHHNILQLVDAFETKKEYFIFLELWVVLGHLLLTVPLQLSQKKRFIESVKCFRVLSKSDILNLGVLFCQCYRQRGLWLDLRSRLLLREGHQQCYEAGVGSCSLPALSENRPQKP